MAVKVFLLDLLPEQAKELAEELQGLVEIGLDHPSIAMPLAAGLEGHTVYLAQEYIAAESLDIALRHLAPTPARKALPLLGQLAGALDFARARGVGHGALHPRDVFVAPEIAKATGFGVVQALERLGVRPPVRRPYSAPERMAGGEWSTPADVYALAAVAHELLTGKRPAGVGEVAPIAGPGAEPYADQLRAVLRQGLVEDPVTRYQNAKAFVGALEAAARGEIQEVARELAVELDVDAERHEEPGEFDRYVTEGGAELDRSESDKLDHIADGARAADRLRDEPIEEAFVQEEALVQEEVVPDEAVRAGGVQATEPRATETVAAIAAVPEEPLEEVGPGERQEKERPAQAQEEAEPWLFDVGDEEASAGAERPVEAVPEAVELDEATSEPPAVPGVEAETMIEPDERRRPAMLSFVAVALVALVAGFLAGYGIGARQSRQAVTAAPPPSAPAAQPAQRAWSEAAVDSPKVKTPVVVPPSEPPVPAESAAPPAVKTPTSRSVSPGAATSRPSTPPRATEPRQAPPASPVVGTGSLMADSRPPGARVILDGRAIGKTPLKLTNVKSGPHTVRLEMAGYRPWTTEITVVAGRDTRVAGSLERTPNR